ncbi:oligosaccharide flippase family protein [Labilibaculum sp. A4]|uniref:oligosaccharide flippase family protein n=1 Tax=Labilibaculum euxinus TaxID=2686357 RepID=UPI000F623DA3|nr:oligosaccharide flippase family protein [Labilibaculum euxinus]MDQ1772718.1 oligosaccharide flippase family protein [Labilibaculum euxinus]MWN78324.1 oligosaccharide flippase family protein [Labilibaculum euxinus]
MNYIIVRLKDRIHRNKGVLRNFSYLSLLQVFNLFLPLITYPYLIRVLGKEIYGIVIFAQAIVGYLMILVGFGFNISATKDVSLHRNNRDKLSEIVSSVFLIKGFLLILAILILSILVMVIPQSNGYEMLFFLTLWMCLYDVIFPIWYFQGIEEMKYITYITLISRLTFLFLIFVFIHSPKDYLYLPIINGFGAILAGVSSLVIVFKKHKIKFKFVSFSCLKSYFIDTFPFFVSNISTTLYMTTSKVVLGAFVGMKEVAYYDLAEKLSTVLKTPIQIIGQAIYPSIAKNRDLVFVRKSFNYTLSIAILIMIVGIGFSGYAVKLIGGIEMIYSVPIFQILLISIIPVTISLFFANLVLVSWGFNKDFLRLRLYTNGFYMCSILILYLVNYLNLYSLAILALIIEFFAAFLAFFFAKKRNVNFCLCPII